VNLGGAAWLGGIPVGNGGGSSVSRGGRKGQCSERERKCGRVGDCVCLQK
jgi:hypothetical protein